MTKFLFAYHGGMSPSNPADMKKVMDAWMKWFEGMGKAVVDGGHPLGQAKTVSAKGVAGNGGANPITGYSLIEAKDIDAAVKLAKGCPIHDGGGSVEVAEAMKM